MKSSFFNLEMDILDGEETMKICEDHLSRGKMLSIYFINAHCFNIAQKNEEYRNAVNEAGLLLNDGIGMKLASLLSKIRFKENLNGTDLIPKIIDLSVQLGKSVFFLGSKQENLEKAVQNLRENKPDIQIAGFRSGFFSAEEEKEIVDEINRSGADILVIGMGVPRQELWASRNMSSFEKLSIVIAGGAIIDFISGEIKRAPLLMRKLKIEWVFRLINEPKRLWKRYLVGNFVFFYHVFVQSLKK